MKKILALLLMILMSLSITSCNGGELLSDNFGSPPPANEAFFLWSSPKSDKIVGYTEEGLKQTELTIPARCTRLEYGALQENPTVEKIFFEGDKIFIDSGVFRKCTALQYVKFPDGITEIPESIFWECSSLVKVEIPNSVTTIRDSAFYQCTKLKNFDFVEGIEEIEDFAFYNCHSLTEVKLPESLKEIGMMSFANCDKLKKVYLPENLTSLEEDSFTHSSNEINVYVKKDSWIDNNFPFSSIKRIVKKYY